MAYTAENLGERCGFCDEGYIIQYRSGKYGCDKYCWKNSPNFKEKPQERGFQPAVKAPLILENLATKELVTKAYTELYTKLNKLEERLTQIEMVITNIESNLIGKGIKDEPVL